MAPQRGPCLAALLAAAGLIAPRAAAPAQQKVAKVPATVGQSKIGGWAASNAGAGAPVSKLAQGPFSFNDPKFFVLTSLSHQLETLTPLAGRPADYVRSVTRLLDSQAVLNNPNSPQAVSAGLIAQVLRNPDQLAWLSANLRSVHPDLGSSVASQLREAVGLTHAAAANDPSLLLGLARAADRIALTGGPGGNGGGLGDYELFADIFDSARGGSNLRDAPSRSPRVSAAANPALELPNRLQPAPRSGTGDDTVLRVGDVGRAVEELSRVRIHDAALDRLVREAAGLNRDLPLDPDRVFLIRKEPELLRLLRLDAGDAGAARTLDDGKRSLSILIVSLPARGRIAPEALVETLLRQAVHAGESGSPRVPAGHTLERWILEGHTQRRIQARMARAAPALRLNGPPEARQAPESRLARALVASIGEAPLQRLAASADASALRQALGPRWTYLEGIAALSARTAAERALRRGNAAPDVRGEAADQATRRAHPGLKASELGAMERILRSPDMSIEDYQATLRFLFPNADPKSISQAAMRAGSPARGDGTSAAPQGRDWRARLRDGWRAVVYWIQRLANRTASRSAEATVGP